MTKFEERTGIEFQNEGQKIFGTLHLPIGQGPFPAVLMCHGFAGTKVGKFRRYVILSESLAKVGIASMRFDFRGSGDSEGHIGNMTLDGEVSDALKALDFFTQFKEIDTNKLGAFGCSLGGVVAILTAARKNCFKSIGLWSPPFNGGQFRKVFEASQVPGLDPQKRIQMMQLEGSSMSEGFVSQFFNLKLGDYLDKLHHVPMVHIHGEKDSTIEVTQADLYKEFRRNSYAITHTLRLPKTDHEFSDKKDQALAIETTVKWFARTLKVE